MKTYTLFLSSKADLVIDEEDFQKFKQHASSGNLIQLKGGIVNPSFVVCILPRKTEVKKQIDGYYDEERGVFVQTGEKVVNPVENQFDTKALADKMRINP